MTAMGNYLIRLQLPDRPGALGAVASRIGSVGGDVVSIDILERTNGVVVDELGVGLGDEAIDLVRGEILEVDGVVVEAILPYWADLPDRYGELLSLTRALFTQSSSSDLLDQLVHAVTASLSATFAVVVDADTLQPAAAAGSRPEQDTLETLARRATVPPPDRVVDDGHDHVGTAVMVQRGLILVVGRDEPILRERERQRLTIMAEIADQGGGRP